MGIKYEFVPAEETPCFMRTPARHIQPMDTDAVHPHAAHVHVIHAHVVHAPTLGSTCACKSALLQGLARETSALPVDLLA